MLSVLDPVEGVLRLSDLKMTALRAGKHKLLVKYRAIPQLLDSAIAVRTSSAVARALATEGVIDGGKGARSGPLTWYKLPEWMQV